MNNTTLSPSSFLLSPSPTFSIIIPVYNVAPYLRECLDSVLAQTFTDWEAICVDDGSTDGSGEILDEYAAKDKRFRIIHQLNAGVSAARNAALDVAQGEWVSFVDADDSIRDDYFVTFLACEDKLDVNFLNMSFVYSDGLRVDRIMRQLKCPLLNNDTESALSAIVHGGDGYDALGWTWDKIIKRKLIDANKIRFVEGISYFEDELFAFDLFRRARSFQILTAPVYRYRRNSGGLTVQGMKNARYEQLIRCFIVRAKESKLTLLKNLAHMRIRGLLQKSLMSNGVSAVELSRVFIEYRRDFPALYTNGFAVRMLKAVRPMPEFLQVRALAFMIAAKRLIG